MTTTNLRQSIMKTNGQQITCLIQARARWALQGYVRNETLKSVVLFTSLIGEGLRRNSGQSTSRSTRPITKVSTMRLKRLCEIVTSASASLAVLGPNVVGISSER